MMLVALTMLATTAEAKKSSLYMYGYGGYVGTIVLPGLYPASFPNQANNMGDGIRHDLVLGGQGKIYIDKDQRIGARLGLGTGLGGYGFTSSAFTLEYDRIERLGNGFDGILGAGIGVGGQTFTNENDNQLRMATYIARGQAMLSYRDKIRAYEGGITVHVIQPGRQYFEAANGNEAEIENEFLGGAFYWYAGFEVGAMFGDFKANNKRKKNKNKNKKRNSAGGKVK